MSFLFAALLVLVAPPRTGEELIRQMHDRYDGKWYRSLTFVQTTTFPDGRQETWYEAAAIPGRLRIDIAPVVEKNTILFSGDSIYQWQRATRRGGGPFVHPLMVLGFDVYAQPVERTLAQLRQLGYDLSKIRADLWQDRAVWVVGADSGDLRRKQFWIDQERLVFVRSLEPTRQDSMVVSEIQFNRYQPLGRGWIAPEVQMFRGGELVMKEEYAQIRTDLTPPADLWDAGVFPEARWMH
jgi:outer membrane lipoprotein-sorting protein